MGNDTEFPHDSEIPIGLLRQAAKDFLQHSGERPTGVTRGIADAGNRASSRCV